MFRSEPEYNAIHKYILKNYSKSGICQFCKAQKKTQWSNVSQEYRKYDRSDWQELCVPCHVKYDSTTPIRALCLDLKREYKELLNQMYGKDVAKEKWASYMQTKPPKRIRVKHRNVYHKIYVNPFFGKWIKVKLLRRKYIIQVSVV